MKLLNLDLSLAKTINAVYKAVAHKDLETYISVLLNLSKRIKVRLGVMHDKDSPDDDLTEKNQNQELKDVENSLSQAEKDQAIFLQFTLLFTSTKLNYLLTQTKVEKYKMQKKLNNLFNTINTFLPESQKLVMSAIQFDEVFPSLFQSGFFKKIAKYFFHKVKPFTKAIAKPEAILGVIVGLSLQNKNLIRTSLVSLIGKEIKEKYINGVYGFIVNDPTQEKDMRSVIKKINLNSQLALNIVEIVSEDFNGDKFNAAYSICKKY